MDIMTRFLALKHMAFMRAGTCKQLGDYNYFVHYCKLPSNHLYPQIQKITKNKEVTCKKEITIRNKCAHLARLTPLQ